MISKTFKMILLLNLFYFCAVKLFRGVFGLIFKIYIGIVFFVTLLIFYIPIAILLTRKSWKKTAFKVHVVWGYAFAFLCLYFFKFKKKSKLPKAPYIIIANHASYLDIFMMYSILPQNPFLFMGKAEILKYPLMKTLFKHLNIPVHRDSQIKSAKAFITAKKALKEGWSIVIFPEGKIPDENSPSMIPFRDGAFKLAKSAKVPLVPLTFTNNYYLFSDPENILGPARPGISHVYMHEHISLETVENLTEKELSNMAFEIINEPILATQK